MIIHRSLAELNGLSFNPVLIHSNNDEKEVPTSGTVIEIHNPADKNAM